MPQVPVDFPPARRQVGGTILTRFGTEASIWPRPVVSPWHSMVL
jgi:hypothetical protein